MKKLVAILVLTLIASNASAILVDTPNNLGLYFDPSADTIQLYDHFMFTQMYLVITNPTFDAIKGLECYVDWVEANCTYYGMILPTGALNVGDQHNVVIGLGSAMATSPITLMATYNLMPSANPTHFALSAALPPSIPGDLPVVVDGNDNMFQINLEFGSGEVCASINSDIVDSESETWGGVKSLYR
jgi:hypothetical protein